jgi:hypothetical protein
VKEYRWNVFQSHVDTLEDNLNTEIFGGWELFSITPTTEERVIVILRQKIDHHPS